VGSCYIYIRGFEHVRPQIRLTVGQTPRNQLLCITNTIFKRTQSMS